MNPEQIKIINIIFNTIKELDTKGIVNMEKTYEGLQIQCTKKSWKFLSKHMFPWFEREKCGSEFRYYFGRWEGVENDYFVISSF